ncbi:helix-turn-helix domain-containing protein [Clostridium sp. LIBA-8841]|uniref:winged helix-turn-helix transcriptional regulator n=1 Tax=Clostridium sp. LIBA-8841 TaxID=2987530 RepID=UPI002AC528CF|nr:helix-turn-helix domain-containing protein [Clostridium sp. LIBA-8841]MDZ5253542.1 helix-turn-helix transcriptional regulator [Clostridium sp. LIBA-8841]
MKKYNKRKINERYIEHALKVLSGKWKLKVLWEVSSYDSIRFNQLQKNIEGISSLMLTRVLKDLIDNKLILRTQFNEIPPHVEYSITDLGKSLCPIIKLLEDFGESILE